MLMPARIAELGIKRNRRIVRHSSSRGHTSRGHNLAEPSRTEGNAVRDWPARPPILIALIDPKPLTREAIVKMLDASFAENVKLLGVSCFDELLDLFSTDEFLDKKDRIFVILYIRNVGVADNWVQEQLRLINSQQPKMPVIMISDRDDADDVMNALNCGVRGYIPTSIAAEVAIAALTLVEAGGTYIPAGALLPEGRGAHENSEKGQQAQQLTEELNFTSLTSRELDVIDLLRQGNTNKVIAKHLNMRESTVKVHVRNIFKKLHATNRTHAAAVANRLLAKLDSIGAAERPH
jgi:DNA-binding NarL/FixJ family response regulator